MPAIEPFLGHFMTKPWGYLRLVAMSNGYTGKVLMRHDGPEFHRQGLQYHPTRDESFHLFSGTVWVYFVRADGVLCKYLMSAGESVHVPPGAVHSVQTVGQSVMFETSEPNDEEAVNVEADWNIETAVEVLSL